MGAGAQFPGESTWSPSSISAFLFVCANVVVEGLRHHYAPSTVRPAGRLQGVALAILAVVTPASAAATAIL
jgi:hypothetical protein